MIEQGQGDVVTVAVCNVQLAQDGSVDASISPHIEAVLRLAKLWIVIVSTKESFPFIETYG